MRIFTKEIMMSCISQGRYSNSLNINKRESEREVHTGIFLGKSSAKNLHTLGVKKVSIFYTNTSFSAKIEHTSVPYLECREKMCFAYFLGVIERTIFFSTSHMQLLTGKPCTWFENITVWYILNIKKNVWQYQLLGVLKKFTF